MEKKIDSSLAGKRLDEALALLSLYPSRSLAQKVIKKGDVLVNGKLEKAHYKLEEGDLISYKEYEEESATLEGEDIPLTVVYEDDDVLLIDKPAGLVVHPGNGHHSGTLVNALIGREMALSNADPKRPGIVHRIDKDTSGLLLITKNDASFAYIQAQLSDHSMHREYKALVKGIILEDEGKIDAPIGRDHIHPTKNAVDVEHGKEAITYFTVLKRFYNDDATLISCRLLTGRTHQIRVHMDYIGHPVIGDPLYGSGNRKIYDKGQLLHAYRLSFRHPKDGKEKSFEIDLPDYFKEVLDKLS